jgi:hypothetical protein
MRDSARESAGFVATILEISSSAVHSLNYTFLGLGLGDASGVWEVGARPEAGGWAVCSPCPDTRSHRSAA